MNYIIQTEKLFKFLEFELDAGQKLIVNKIKNKFHNDLNLFCCFIKDYLAIKNDFSHPSDDDIYSDFVLYLKNSEADVVLSELEIYSDLFIKVVFEEEKNPLLRNAIAIVNSCFMLEYYPILLYVARKYYEKEIDLANLDRVLKAIESDVLANFENATSDLAGIIKFVKQQIEIDSQERVAS